MSFISLATMAEGNVGSAIHSTRHLSANRPRLNVKLIVGLALGVREVITVA